VRSAVPCKVINMLNAVFYRMDRLNSWWLYTVLCIMQRAGEPLITHVPDYLVDAYIEYTYTCIYICIYTYIYVCT